MTLFNHRFFNLLGGLGIALAFVLLASPALANEQASALADLPGDGISAVTRINESMSGTRATPHIVTFSDGRQAVTWEEGEDVSSLYGKRIRGQFLDSAGNDIGSNFTVGDPGERDAGTHHIAPLSSARFVATWMEQRAFGPDSDGRAVVFRIFGADPAQNSTTIVANSTVTGDQTLPSVAALSNGNFVVTWEDRSAIGAQPPNPVPRARIRARIFDSVGNPVGTEFYVAQNAMDHLRRPMVTGLDSGGFMIAWGREGSETEPDFVAARFFDASGTATTPDLDISGGVEQDLSNLDIQALSSDRVALVWENGTEATGRIVLTIIGSNGSAILAPTMIASDASLPAVNRRDAGEFWLSWRENQNIQIQRFNTDGNAIGPRIDPGASAAYGSDIAMTPDGNARLVWMTPDDNAAIRSVVIETSGLSDNAAPDAVDDSFPSVGTTTLNAVNDFLVATESDELQQNPGIAALPNGNFVIVFQDSSNSLDPENAGILARIFSSDGTPVGSDFLVNQTTASFQTEPVVTTLDDGRFVVAWQTITGTNSTAIVGRIFSATGTPAGPEFLIANNSFRPSLTALPGGGFAASIRSRGGRTLITVPTFDNAGNPAGFLSPPPSSITPPNGRDLHHLATSISRHGSEVVVAWSDVEVQQTQINLPPDFYNRTVRFRRMNLNNTVLDSNIVVRTLGSGSTPNAPVVTHLLTGSFVIVWEETYTPQGATESVEAIRGQRYNPDGTTVDGVFDIAMPFATTGISDPKIVTMQDGGFLVTFLYQADSGSDQDEWAVGAQRFQANGAVGGPGFTVNTTTVNSQITASAASLSQGNLVFTFADNSRDDVPDANFRYDIRARVFAPIFVPYNVAHIPVLANDSDPDGDPLTITHIAQQAVPGETPLDLPSGAVVARAGEQITYMASTAAFATALPSGVTADDSFTYTISDGSLTDQATVTVTVTGVNDAPSADPESLFIPEDTPALDVTTQLLDGDTDPDTGETAQLAIIGVDTTGTIGEASLVNGALSYAPGSGYDYLAQGASAVDIFTYTISDPDGLTDSARVDVTVTGVNDAPTANNLSGQLNEDSRPADITNVALSSLTDPDTGDSHTITAIDTAGTRGLVTLIGGQLVYDPRGYFPDLNDGQSFDDSFGYTITDSVGASNSARVAMSITGVSNVLSVRLEGLGDGRVASSPSRIVCGNTGRDCADNFTENQSVTLTAAPVDGSQFDGWTSGPCTGQTGDCVLTISGDVVVGARFSLTDIPAGRIVAATLPGARSGYVGGPVTTAFMSVVSRASTPAQGCRITAPGSPPFTFAYQALDGGNQPKGPQNALFDLAQGGTMSFILSMTPTTTTGSSGYLFQPQIACENADLAPIDGVNSILLAIGSAPVPDLLSINATPSADGVVRIPETGNRIGFMTASVVNIGTGDGVFNDPNEARVFITGDTGSASLPVTVEVCETAPTGGCITPRFEGQFNLTFRSNDPRYFAVFVRANEGASIPFDPANARVYLSFAAANSVRSITSAAIVAPLPASDLPHTALAGRWSVLLRQDSGDWPSLERADLHVLGNGSALIRQGGQVHLVNITTLPASTPDRLVFELSGRQGVATPSGQIGLGDALADQPGAFWGVRDDRSDRPENWLAHVGTYGGIQIAEDGVINGSIMGCDAFGRALGSERAVSITLTGCDQGGHYIALIDTLANDNDVPALLIANEERGWRIPQGDAVRVMLRFP